jgi:hypothetical protein
MGVKLSKHAAQICVLYPAEFIVHEKKMGPNTPIVTLLAHLTPKLMP